MAEGKPGRNNEDLKIMTEWNQGYHGDYSRTIQVNRNGDVPSYEVITPITTFHEEILPRNLLGFTWGDLGDHPHQGAQRLDQELNVTTYQQDVPASSNHADWPSNNGFQGGMTGSVKGYLVDGSHVDRMSIPADVIFPSNQVQYASGPTAYGNLNWSTIIPDQQVVGGTPLVAAGIIYGANGEEIVGNQVDGPEGLPTAAVEIGMHGPPSAPWPSNDSRAEFQRNFHKLSAQIEQASLALFSSPPFNPSQPYSPSLQTCSPAYVPSNPGASSAPVAAFPRDHYLTPSGLPMPSPPLPPQAELLNLPTNFGNVKCLPDQTITSFGDLGFFHPHSILDASPHDHRPCASSGPMNFGPPPPDYPGFTMSYPALQCESFVKPLSPSSASFEMDPPVLNTPKTPPYSFSASSPSTAEAKSVKKRSSLSGHINFPSPIKESNFESSVLITKKSRGRRPVTRPGLVKSSDDKAAFTNMVLQHAPGVQAPGRSICSVISDPEVLNLMETDRTSNVKKAFVCQIGDCGKCFRRCEHLRRHVRTIHSAEKPFQCPWLTCQRTFNRSDNLKQHFQTHIRRV